MQGLYRGKRIDNSEWVYGYLLETGDKAFIVVDCEKVSNDGEETDLFATEWYEVDPKTVSQHCCEGIYEGDYLQISAYPGENYYVEICKNDNPPHNWIYGYIKKPESKVSGISNGIYQNLDDLEELGTVEVVGNRWDNPELLEVR